MDEQTFETTGSDRLERATARLGGETLDIVTYRGRSNACQALVIMFAGRSRDAEGLVRKARTLAERNNFAIVAPEMDRERFPTWRYHRAGVAQRTVMQPREHWIGPIVNDLIAWARRWTALPSVGTILFGHSAGGQLLSRVAAYCPPTDIDRIVISNPSVYVAPSLTEMAPHGFAKLFGSEEALIRLQSYVAQPISIYLGCDDIGAKDLVGNPAARRQGMHRLERGRSVFRQAEALARTQGWHFGWRLVEVANVGHSSRGMLAAPEVLTALGIETAIDHGLSANTSPAAF
ncbi:MAG: hypothetical protein ACR2Q4_03415 [Geminicoccaceae bacterium]